MCKKSAKEDSLQIWTIDNEETHPEMSETPTSKAADYMASPHTLSKSITYILISKSNTALHAFHRPQRTNRKSMSTAK